jgi:hypothetical protein
MYEAWQAQQKAQKDEERRRKTEATEALQSYRRAGLSEEETKLALLRDEERLKKADAEKQLHGYRGQMSEEEARMAALRHEELRKKQLLEEQLRGNGVVTSSEGGVHASLKGMENSGAVEAMRAQFVGTDGLPLSPSGSTHNGTTTKSNSAAPFGSGPEDVDAMNGTVSSLAAQYSTSQEEEQSKLEGMTEDVPSYPVSSSVPPVVGPTPPKAGTVSFMFGILTSSSGHIASTNDVDGYLARADQIARTVIMNNPDSFISISLDYPVVKALEKDYGTFEVVCSCCCRCRCQQII